MGNARRGILYCSKPADHDAVNMTLYKKVFTRSMSLMLAECWEAGERERIPKVCGDVFWGTPLFLYRPDTGVEIFYNWSDAKQDPANLYQFFASHSEQWELVRKDFLACCNEIEELDNAGDKEGLLVLIELLKRLWAGFPVVMLLGDCSNPILPKFIQQEALATRAQTADIFFLADIKLTECIARCLPADRHADAPFLLSTDVLGAFPSRQTLEDRRNGFLYQQGELIPASMISSYLREHGFELVENVVIGNETLLYGQCASEGIVRGTVRIVRTSKDMVKVSAGDIVVSPMTTPDLLPAMKLSSAIVTDEGGLTCHAAVVARELGKPCIIGTKIATKVLKDGDMVEVDAEKGIVRIIERL